MRKPKFSLSDVEVDEISLVDKGDNPRARFVLAKRKHGAAGLYASALKALEGVVGAVSEPLRKRLYDEVREAQAKDSAADILRRRLDALSESVYSTLYFRPDEGEEPIDVEAVLKESIAQFAEGVSGEVPDILAGRIMKTFGGADPPPTQEEFTEEFALKFQELAKDLETPGARGPDDDKENDMDKIDLTKLDISDEQRAELEKALKAQAETEGLKAKVAELEKAAKKEPPKKDEPTEDDLRKALPEDVRKLFDAQEARHQADMKKRDDLIAGLTETAERDAFAKSLDFKKLPGTVESLAKMLYPIQKEQREEIVKYLDAVDKQLEQAADITRALGQEVVDDEGDRQGTAKGKLDAAAVEIRKAQPELTPEQAFDRALVAHPDLYNDYLRETAGRPN